MRYSVFYHDVKTEYDCFITAGIEVTDDNGKTIHKLYDVSTDFEPLKELVKRLNCEKVEYEHLESVIEDYYLEHY